jgi:alpha/beta superfamily hydrolase
VNSQTNIVKERAVRMGKPVPLVGIISEPEAFNPERPAVLIFNSGVMHHIGTCRLSVRLARAFAKMGNLSIRFDFSGIGDSEPRRGTDSFEESAPKEAVEVMDYLQKKRGVKKFVVYGLCSGADAAYFTAIGDERVVGFAQIDPYCYRTSKYYFHYYASRFLVLDRWFSSARRLFKVVTGTARKNDAATMAGIEEEYYEMAEYVREFPPRDEVSSGLKKLFNRGVENYVIFTGGEAQYNYRLQYKDSFSDVPFGGLLRLDYLMESNHILTDPRHQKQVIEGLTHWLEALSNDVDTTEVA